MGREQKKTLEDPTVKQQCPSQDTAEDLGPVTGRNRKPEAVFASRKPAGMI
jgi:hypothetical protein